MKRLSEQAVLAALMLTCGSHLFAYQGGTLTVEPELIESRYCGEDSGNLTLLVSVKFRYRNISQNTILLPLFFQFAQYGLFTDEQSLSANRPDRVERVRVRRLFDIAKLDGTKPDQKLFDSMAPGSSRSRILEIPIFLRSPGRSRLPLLGSDVYLRVEINQWFENRKAGEDLRRRWREFGFLWIDNVWSEPLRLHIERDPVPQRCSVRID